MRLNHIPNISDLTDPSERKVLDDIRARRGSEGLLDLDRALLHSMPLAAGWNAFFGAIRTQTHLPDDMREIVICRVAAINRAWYEWDHHAPLARKAGVSELALNSVLHSRKDDLNDTAQRVLSFTDAMTKEVVVDDLLFEEILATFSSKQVMELTLTVAAYNCVSRFLVALNIGSCNERGPSTSATLSNAENKHL